MGRRERERRLAHAERARHDNGPVLFEDRLDELLQPILAADHPWVGRQRRRATAGCGRRRPGVGMGSGGVGWDGCGPARSCGRRSPPRFPRSRWPRPPCADRGRWAGSLRTALPPRGRRFLSRTTSSPASAVGVSKQRIEADVLAIFLPLANDGDFLVHDIVGRRRMARDQQYEHVAFAQLALDLRDPVVAAAHQCVDPEVDGALLDRRPEMSGHERQPLNLVARAAFLARPRGRS